MRRLIKRPRSIQSIINDITGLKRLTGAEYSAGLASLQNELITLSKRANVRLKALETAGKARWAYDRATLFTQESNGGKKRFFQGKISDLKALRAQFEEVTRFLNSRSSTLSGQAEIFNERVERFENLLNVPDSPDLDEFVQEVLESGYYNDLKTYIPSTDFNTYLAKIWEQMGSDIDTQSFISDLGAYTRGELYIDELLEKYGVDYFGE